MPTLLYEPENENSVRSTYTYYEYYSNNTEEITEKLSPKTIRELQVNTAKKRRKKEHQIRSKSRTNLKKRKKEIKKTIVENIKFNNRHLTEYKKPDSRMGSITRSSVAGSLTIQKKKFRFMRSINKSNKFSI